MKNKILLFFILLCNYNTVFAEEGQQSQLQNANFNDDEIARLTRENALLELQMRNKFLKKEIEKVQKEDANSQNNGKESDKSKVDKEIKQLQDEIEILQHKHNLFIAKQADSEEFREQSKKNFEITSKKNSLEAKIELAKKEIELKNLERARDRIIEENKVEYLENPLLKDGILVLSDRQIHIGHSIDENTAKEVENDIDFYNNKNNKLPIFLVFDRCNGGDVIAGYKIVNKMKYSQAPVYVLVKEYAFSMAAVITTLATRSFCLKDSVILHHQPNKTSFIDQKNVKEAEEEWKRLKEIWGRLMGPVVKKMGITLDAFMKKMYEKNSHGDWMEYGEEAKKLHWVDEVVMTVRDTSVKVKYKDQPKDKDLPNHKEQMEYDYQLEKQCLLKY